MRAFVLAALCPLAVQAAAIARQDCPATTTITAQQEVYATVHKSTNTATYLRLATAAADEKLKRRQDCSPSATVTVTQPTTVTMTKAAQTTISAPACQASNNYGLFNGSISLNSQQKGSASIQTFSDYTIDECCNACFTSTDGCMAWSFDGTTDGSDNVTPGCSMSIVSGGCPSSSGTQAILYPNSAKPVVGVGSCDVEVSHFG